MGEIEFGKCEICGKEKKLTRTYFHYNLKCKCHSPNHFDVVIHCADCIPERPEESDVTLFTKDLIDYNSEFISKLTTLINNYSLENPSNTPDFILAKYLYHCLESFSDTMKYRDKWYNINQENNTII